MSTYLLNPRAIQRVNPSPRFLLNLRRFRPTGRQSRVRTHTPVSTRRTQSILRQDIQFDSSRLRATSFLEQNLHE